jgi:hypothetical protein
MKRILLICIFAISLSGLSSCAVHSGLTTNLNQNTTQVVLSRNNYEIVKKVKDRASGLSIFGIGGSFGPLIAKARAKMLEKANLVGSSRAIINETVEVNFKNFFIIVNMKTVTVSAYVIEFFE